MTNNDLDALILSIATDRWQKVARLIGVAADELNEAVPRFDELADRIQALAAEGRLESQGNLARWRYSEVRLAGAPGSDRN